MKLMVCGSIGYGGVKEIRQWYCAIQEQGFETINHIDEKGMDYSDISDFGDLKDLSRKIIEHDLAFIEKSDVVVVLADPPSFGAAIEMYIAKNAGKKVVLVAPRAIPTPWPVYFSNYVVKTKEELFQVLKELEKTRF